MLSTRCLEARFSHMPLQRESHMFHAITVIKSQCRWCDKSDYIITEVVTIQSQFSKSDCWNRNFCCVDVLCVLNFCFTTNDLFCTEVGLHVASTHRKMNLTRCILVRPKVNILSTRKPSSSPQYYISNPQMKKSTCWTPTKGRIFSGELGGGNSGDFEKAPFIMRKQICEFWTSLYMMLYTNAIGTTSYRWVIFCIFFLNALKYDLMCVSNQTCAEIANGW